MSGYIGSPVKEIERIQINPWPTALKEGMRVVRIDRTIVGMSPGGAIYSNQCSGKFHYSFPGDGNQDDLVRALVKLGRLTEEQGELHVKRAQQARECADRAWKGEQLLESAETLGLHLPRDIKAVALQAISEDPRAKQSWEDRQARKKAAQK